MINPFEDPSDMNPANWDCCDEHETVVPQGRCLSKVRAGAGGCRYKLVPCRMGPRSSFLRRQMLEAMLPPCVAVVARLAHGLQVIPGQT